jgi:hypothetical protein
MRSAEGIGLDGELAQDVREEIVRPARDLPTVPDALRGRLVFGDSGSLSPDDRAAIAVGLMLGRNKVTHIYELVKAAGSGRQVEYVRSRRAWQRREAIARKHAYESAVDPFGGSVVRGVDHAPLLVDDDPRTDLPGALGQRVGEAIDGLDPKTVAGWLAAADR